MRLDFPWLLADPDEGRVLSNLAGAPAETVDQVLSELASAASGSPAARNLYAVAAAVTGRVSEAATQLRAVLNETPDFTVARLNLATVYIVTRQPLLALHELETASAGATDPSGKSMAQERLESLQRWRSQYTQALQLTNLRVEMLRERIATGRARPSDRRDLGRISLNLAEVPGSTVSLSEAVVALEEAYLHDPSDVTVSELLAKALLMAGDRTRLDEVLQNLERIAPHSSVMEAFRLGRDGEDLSESANERIQKVWQLIELALSDTDSAAAAAEELQRLSKTNPRDLFSRVGVMMVALISGDQQEAEKLADGLAAEEYLGHLEHFHIAQVYWENARDRAYHHLALAYETASDDSDRQDVAALLHRLEASDG